MVGNYRKLKEKTAIFFSSVLLCVIGQCLFVMKHSSIYYFICFSNGIQIWYEIWHLMEVFYETEDLSFKNACKTLSLVVKESMAGSNLTL